MRFIRRLLWWIALTAAVLLFLLLLFVLVAPLTSGFRNFVRVQAISYLNRNFRGQFSVGQVEGSIWGGLRLGDLKISYDDLPVLSIPLVKVKYRLLPLLTGKVDISSLAIERPSIHLARVNGNQWNVGDQWNLLAALSSAHGSANGSGSSIAISISRFSIDGADASVQQAGGKPFKVADTDIAGKIKIDGQETRVQIKSLRSQAMLSDAPPIKLDGKLTYRDVGHGASIEFPNLILSTQASRLRLAGAVTDLSPIVMNANLKVVKLAASDINAMFPNIGLVQDLSGTLQLHAKTLKEVRAEAALCGGQATFHGQVLADLAENTPAYHGQAEVENLDLQELLKQTGGRRLPGGVINGSIQVHGKGFGIGNVIAETQLTDREVAVYDWNLGNLTLAGSLKSGVANLDASIVNQAGHASLKGSIHTQGEMIYKAKLAVDHLQPRKAQELRMTQTPSSGAVPSGDLNLTAAFEGVGFYPATMKATARLDVLRSTIGGVTLDKGEVQARIAAGVLHLARLNFKAQQSSASANGEVAFVKRQRGTVHYAVDIGDLHPWLALIGRQGQGQIKIDGNADGNLHSLRASGSGHMTMVRFEEYSAKQGVLRYDVGGFGKAGGLRGSAALALRNVRAISDLESVAVEVRLAPERFQTAYLRIDAAQSASRVSKVTARVAYEPRRLRVDLSHLSLSTDAGTWRLVEPAIISREGPKIRIDALKVINGTAMVFIDGFVSESGAQKLDATVRQLNISPFSTFLPNQTKIQGLLSTKLSVRGTASVPAVTLTGGVGDLRIDGVRYQDLSANIQYANRLASLAMHMNQDTQHWIRASGSLPVALSWANGFRHEVSGNITLEAKSPGLDLAFLDALTNEVSDVGGTLSMDITAQGPLQHPHSSGFLTLNDGKFKIVPLNVPVRNVTAHLRLSPEQLQLASLYASAKDGSLRGRGSISLIGPEHPTDLSITLDKWPAIATAEYQATVAGQVKCSGPTNALRVDARTEVLDGIFRPPLSLLQARSLEPDKTIKVSESWSVPAQGGSKPRDHSGPHANSIWQNSTLKLDTDIHRNTWIDTSDAQVEIKGAIHVFKPPRAQPVITGRIESVRGSMAVAGKTFTIQQGQIMFTGGREIDPSLDIVAQYDTQGYQVLATINGTAKKPELALSSVPILSQSDILSVLLFGKPSNQLTDGQQKNLEQQALSMAGGYAASQLGKAVAQALGLETLGINVAPGGGLGLGTYLMQNVYVSASQEAGGTYGHRASLGYYITPHLELETSASTTQGNQITLEWSKDY